MKIACSSATFAARIAAGTLTHLEWLDVCANELEVDGVVVDARDLPRDDDDYLAQIKKSAADLGLTIAALDCDAVLGEAVETWLAVAVALGAPLTIARARAASSDPSAWGDFTDDVKDAAGAAKRANVTLAIRPAPQTLCTSLADVRRIAKDVDSAWIRYTLSVPDASARDDLAAVLPNVTIAVHAIADLATFATPGDDEAQRLVAALARFRGFVVLEAERAIEHGHAYHSAVERFTHQRSQSLAAALTPHPI